VGKRNILLDDLLDEVGDFKTRPPVSRRKVSEIPDALVLIIVDIKCKYCGTEYSYPNPQILGRYGRNHKRIKKWSSLFESLPRERLHIAEKATGCQNCFEHGIFRTGEMEEGT